MDESRFLELSEDYNLIPIHKEIIADTMTPVSIYKKLTGKDDYSYLLESATTGRKLNVGRYSFIGIEPELILSHKDGKTSIKGRDGGEEKQIKGDFRQVVTDLMARYNTLSPAELPPFSGGLVGYFGYEMISSWEDIFHGEPNRDLSKSNLPESVLVLSRTVLAYDHLDNTLKIIYNAHIEDEKTEKEKRKLYREAVEKIEGIIDRINGKGHHSTSNPSPLSLADMSHHTDENEFQRMVKKAKNYIREGEAFQIVLSQKFSLDVEVSSFEVYRALRVSNPSPYMFYLNYPEVKLIGSSPEMLVRVQGRRIVTRPLAGTRPRGETAREDSSLKEDLLQDEKEKAEHTMLVDLGRNDLGRVCKYGSVEVTELMEIELYSQVMHIASQVEGEMRDDIGVMDVLSSVFPAGTVTGAPKIRAIELIESLEKTPRGPYAGTVGYLDFSGNLDTCITIRTFFMQDGKLTARVGAGMVADSVPEKEQKEILDKAGALFQALRIIEEDKLHGPGNRQL